jgi:hypothetical protein
MTDRLIFHESFDSTRCTADDVSEHPNLTQGQVEAVISLLLGRSLSINNTYGFDSRTLLELADAVLSTRSLVLARYSGDPGAHARLTAALPFVLHRWAQPTYLAACADQFARADKSARDYFRLSAWAPVNDDRAARTSLADLLRAIHGGNAHRSVPRWLAADHPELALRFDTLLRLDDYFRDPRSDRDARRPNISQADYTEHLLSLTPERYAEIAAEQACPPDIANAVRRAVEAHAVAAGAAGVNRGWAHDTVAATADDDPDLLPRQQVRELVDTLYNAVLADSAFAEFEYMSSAPRSDGRDELKHVNSLSLGLIRDTRSKDQPRRSDEEDRASTRMGGMLAAASEAPHLPVQPMRTIFMAYWELLADAERARTWHQSTTLLHEVLGAVEFDADMLSDVWASHLAELSRTLPGMVSAADTQMWICVEDAANAYAQTQQLGPLSAADLDRSLAAGEHLDNLAHQSDADRTRRVAG